MDGFGRNLTLKQQKGLAALLAEPTIESAARAARISKETLYQWMKEPDFKAALDGARHLLFGDGLASLKAAMGEAVEALRQALNEPDATVANKITAATKLIELALRSHETLEVEARLAALEQQMTKGHYAKSKTN